MGKKLGIDMNPCEGGWSIGEIEFRIECIYDEESLKEELDYLIRLKGELEIYEKTKKEIDEYSKEVQYEYFEEYDNYDGNKEIEVEEGLYEEYYKVKGILNDYYELESLVKKYNKEFPTDSIDKLAYKIRANPRYKNIKNKRKIISCIRCIKNIRNRKELIVYEFTLNIKALELFMRLCDERDDDTLFDNINDLQKEISSSIEWLKKNDSNNNLGFIGSKVRSEYIDKLDDINTLLENLIYFESYRNREKSDIMHLYNLCDTLNDKEINLKYKKKNKKGTRLYKSLKRDENKRIIVEEIIRLINSSKDKEITNREIAITVGKSESYISKLRKEYNL